MSRCRTDVRAFAPFPDEAQVLDGTGAGGPEPALHTPGSTGHGHHPPTEVSATSAAITARMAGVEWEIVTADEHVRTLTGHGGGAATLRDAVGRATRRR